MKDIKRRIKSVESTRQITKAMELVASSKLRRAKERAERSRPYFETLHATLMDIAYSDREFSSPYIRQRTVVRSCYIVIAGDRGLAGGYNANVLKAADTHMKGKDVVVLPVGKKALEHYQRKGYELIHTRLNKADSVADIDVMELSETLANGYLRGAFDEVIIFYTNFVSMLTQEPAHIRILPINYNRQLAQKSQEGKQLITYEPSAEQVFDQIVPQYVSGIVRGALIESLASEQGARRTAMEAASSNADEMIEALSLSYNRARQGAITQEITEISAGAQALT